MRLIINLLLLGAIIILGWLLVTNIQEPIKFQAEKDKRESAVVSQLKEVRTSLEIYKAITGEYPNTFDTLKLVLKSGQIPIVQVYDDPSDPTGESYIYDTLYFSAIDSMRSLGISIDSLDLVPYSDGAKFQIQSDTMTYQSTLVDVVEVGVRRKVFMGPYADPRFGKYDNSYDPNSMLKFGDMNAPNLSGNWGER